MNRGGTDLPALLALIAGAVLIGFAPIFVRVSEVGLTATAFWRCALALPPLALLLLRQTGTLRPVAGTHALLLAGLLFAADLAFWHQAIHDSSVANATLITNLAPVFVTLASFLLFGERFRKTFLAGLALAVVGAALLMSDSLRRSARHLHGDWLALISALFYAGYLISVSRARRQHSAVQLMFWATLASAVALLALSQWRGEALWPRSLHGWSVVLGLALLSQLAGQGLIAWAMAHLSASFSAVGLLVQPVAAAAFAWLLLAEPTGGAQVLGGAVVLAGIVVCRRAMPARAVSGACDTSDAPDPPTRP